MAFGAQLKQYQERKCFEVIGLSHRQAIPDSPRTEANVYELDEKAGRRGLVLRAERSLVAGDVMLAQKIALETDEQGALKVANNFSLR